MPIPIHDIGRKRHRTSNSRSVGVQYSGFGHNIAAHYNSADNTGGGSDNQISQYHQTSNLYKYKGGNKRAIRRVEKKKHAYDRVVRALEVEIPTNTFVYTYAQTMAVSATYFKNTGLIIPICGYNGSGTTADGMMATLLTDVSKLNTAASNPNFTATTRSLKGFELTRAVLDLHLTNVIGQTNPVIADIYYFECRKSYNSTSMSNATSVSDSAYATTNNQPSANNWGVDPFQMKDFTQHFLIKSKERLLIPVGQTVFKQYTANDGKKRNLDASDITDGTTLCAKAGLTCGVYIQLWGFPTTQTGNTPTMLSGQLDVSTMWRMTVKPTFSSNFPSILENL